MTKIVELIIQCVEYTLYMNELYFTKEEKQKLKEWVEKKDE